MGEGEVANPLEHAADITKYPPQPFVLISKAYSDGISIIKEGPLITKTFKSVCQFNCERSFRTSAKFVPKMVPHRFVTTLTVAEDLTFYECVAFERRTVMKEYSETTNIFLPKELIRNNHSLLCFDPDATTLYYTARLELLPAIKVIVETELNRDGGDTTGCLEKSVMNGQICERLNGEIF